MKILSSILVLGVALPALSAPQLESNLAEPPLLVQQLSSDDFQVREEAMRQLWAKGEIYLESLKLASTSSDPELAIRSGNLVRNIEAGILPTTDKSVVKAIDLYRSAQSLRVKTKALNDLIGLKALKQVIYLMHWEQDTEIKKALNEDSRIASVALAAAHGSLKDDDAEGAIALLRIAPKSDFNLRGLAHILKYSGKIDAEIENNSKNLTSSSAKDWQFTLLKVNGDVSKLKSFAKVHGEVGALSTVALLEGDPYPVIKALMERSSDDTHREALSMLKEFHRAGDASSSTKELTKLIDKLDPLANSGKDLNYLIHLAMLMGERELGEKLLSQQDKLTNLNYYKVQEYSEKEFALLGVPNPITQSADFELWLAQEVARELDGELGLLDDQGSKIEQVAEFFNTRGDEQMAHSILKPLVDALTEENSDRWFDLLSSLPVRGMRNVAIQLAFERNGDAETWEILSHSFFGNVEETNQLWSEIRNLRPNTTDREQFSHMLAVMGMRTQVGSDEGDLESEIYSKALKMGGREYIKMMEILAFAAEKRGDVVSMLKYYKELGSDSTRENFKSYLSGYQLSAQLQSDWGEIVNSFELDPGGYKDSAYKLTTYSIAKRKLGQNEEAEVGLARAKLLTLGTTKTLNKIAGMLHDAGYKEEAATMWLDLLLNSDTDDWDFFYTLNFINNQSRFHLRNEKWDLASAFYLVEKAIYMDPQVHDIEAYRLLKKGYLSHFTRGMELLESGDRKVAIKMLGHAHDSIVGDGSLADDFFPSLRGKGLRKVVDEWFSRSWSHLNSEIEMYPKDHNARNTAAWLGARYVSHLDESLKHSKAALALHPKQPAYLDTLAEIYFAKRDRKNAIKHSEIALKSIKFGAYAYTRAAANAADMYNELLKQNNRFRSAPFPKPRD